MEEFQDLMSYHTKKLIEKINQQKEQILMEHLRRLDIRLTLVELRRSRFKKLMCEKHQGDVMKETWYYDNGTNDGLRVVTFETISVQPTLDDSNFSTSIELKLKFY